MFSAKLGEDAEQIGLGFISRWMPGGGHPKGHLICNSSLGATSLLHCILPYFFWNVPLAATFILQHSVLRKALQRSFGSWGRRIYSFTSAVALHLFMRNYQDSLKMLLLLHSCQVLYSTSHPSSFPSLQLLWFLTSFSSSHNIPKPTNGSPMPGTLHAFDPWPYTLEPESTNHSFLEPTPLRQTSSTPESTALKH